MSENRAQSASRQSQNCRHNFFNNLTSQTSPSLITRLLVITAAVLLVTASAGFGALFAWRVGSRHDVILGLLSVAMAVGLEVSKPFTIAGAFAAVRRLQLATAAALALAGVLAIGYSLQAELTFMASTRGDMVAERAGEASAGNRAERRYEAAAAALVALKPAGTTKSATNAYLAQREALRRELEAAEHDRRQAPPAIIADPGAVALATYAAAVGIDTDPDTLGKWLPLVGVLALEIGAAFAVLLVRSVNGTQAATVTQESAPALTHADSAGISEKPLAALPGAKKTAKRIKVSKRDDDDPPGTSRRGLPALLDQLNANGGVVELSQRRLARKIGVGLGTLQRSLSELAASGAVVLDTSRTGTRIALA